MNKSTHIFFAVLHRNVLSLDKSLKLEAIVSLFKQNHITGIKINSLSFSTLILILLITPLLITNCASSEILTGSSDKARDNSSSTSSNFPSSGELKNVAINISAKDNSNMIFIPDGMFEMGSEDGNANEKPVHTVFLDAYWIDQTEVTNRMYGLCVKDAVCSRPGSTVYYDDDAYLDYPVVFIEWDQAKTYCEWAGERLPTEAEWEKAAHGTQSLVYPWGNENPTSNLLNFERSVGTITSVGSYPEGASRYGVLDMAGNVREWVSDWYDPHYYEISPEANPQGPDSSLYHICRGGGWADYWMGVRTTHRMSGSCAYVKYYEEMYFYRHHFVVNDLGFRCVLSE